jgi:hypothetical protein
VSSLEGERPDLLRLWLEFDVAEHAPESAPPGVIQLDGGNEIWRAFGGGVGVTGYDEADCLALVAESYGLSLPPVTYRIVDVTPALLRERSKPAANEIVQRAVMVWRGVWYLRSNLGRGPVLPGLP